MSDGAHLSATPPSSGLTMSIHELPPLVAASPEATPQHITLSTSTHRGRSADFGKEPEPVSVSRGRLARSVTKKFSAERLNFFEQMRRATSGGTEFSLPNRPARKEEAPHCESGATNWSPTGDAQTMTQAWRPASCRQVTRPGGRRPSGTVSRVRRWCPSVRLRRRRVKG